MGYGEEIFFFSISGIFVFIHNPIALHTAERGRILFSETIAIPGIFTAITAEAMSNCLMRMGKWNVAPINKERFSMPMAIPKINTGMANIKYRTRVLPNGSMINGARHEK